jgi:hypothetical protein
MMLLNGFMLPVSQLGWWFRWYVCLSDETVLASALQSVYP